jgi:hypothetical protein
MHSEVGPNGMVGLASLRKTGTPHSTLRLIWLRANTEFTAYYRQESLNGSAASFDILRLFSHHQMAITDSIVRIRDPAHRAFSEPAQLYAVRIFIPQYATTTARTTQAVSNAVSRAESLIRLLSVAHPAGKLCDSISERPLPL